MLDVEYLLKYAPLAFTIVAGVVLVGMTFLIARLMAPRQASSWKLTTFESGMPSEPGDWAQTNIRYYLYAILFVIFEVEALFILPWTIVLRDLGPAAFAEMMVFLGVLAFALIYAWRKGVLQWR